MKHMALSTLSAGTACTHNTVFGLFNMPCANDASAIILQEIFGREVASMVTGMTMPPKAELIPQFLHNFNAVILTGVLLIYAVIICVGTVNTGHHGKFLGQQWDSIWTPLRAIGGTSLMVPLKYGLCGAQVIILGLILYGAHAASVVWHQSLHNVYYGTPPTVPASAIDIVKQAVANDIVMTTYDTPLTPGRHIDPAQNIFLSKGWVSFISPDAYNLRNEIQKTFPNFCKIALNLGTYNSNGTMTLFPDSKITGVNRSRYSACLGVGNDFLQSGQDTTFQTSKYTASFDVSPDTTPAQVWVGFYFPTRNTCDPEQVAIPGQVTPTCYQSFPGAKPSSVPGHTPYVSTSFPNPTNEAVQTQLIGQIFGAKTSLLNTYPQPTDGSVELDASAEYVPPVSNPNASQRALLTALKTFITKNITSPECLTPTPPSTCSNNISGIVTAYNNALSTTNTFPKKGYKISNTTKTPTAASPHQSIPGTHTPLNSSWWNAGEIYLIIDKQMAANLSELYQQLNSLVGKDPVGHYVSNNITQTTLSMALGKYKDNLAYTASGVFTAYNNSGTTEVNLWNQFLQPYKTSNPYLYNKLKNVPAADTLAFLLLGKHVSSYSLAPQKMYILTRLYDVMQANGMLGSNYSSSLTPITSAMNKIFEGLLGSSDGATVANSVTNLMNEVYNLGVSNNAYGMIGKNLSVIQNAQRTGMDMIVTTMNSISSVYNHFEDQYQDLRNKVQAIGIGTTVGAGVLASAAVAAGFGGPFSAGAAAGLGAMSEVTAQAGQMAIQITALLKMSSILQSLMWLPVVIMVLTALFTAGVAFALMLPLTPFILFWAGQIAWILGCLEAVIAAPFLKGAPSS